MNLFKTNTEEVLKIGNSLDNKYSSGDDYISNIIVKKLSEVVAPFLAFITNLLFSKSLFPRNLCNAKVFPLHKEGSRTDENNYRPISLLIVCSKIVKSMNEQCTTVHILTLKNSPCSILINMVFVVNIVQLMHWQNYKNYLY